MVGRDERNPGLLQRAYRNGRVHPPHPHSRRHHRGAPAGGTPRRARRLSALPCPLPGGRATRSICRLRSASAASAARRGWRTICALEAIDALVDATHPSPPPCRSTRPRRRGSPACRCSPLARRAWERRPGDIWREAENVTEAVEQLGAAPRRVLVAPRAQRGGRAGGGAATFLSWCAASIRSNRRFAWTMHATSWRAARFPRRMSWHLLERHGIDAVLAKNSSGDATYGKIAAARDAGDRGGADQAPRPARRC